MPSGASISDWLPGVKAGEKAAVDRLWERYFQRLVEFADKRLRGKWRRVADGEDAALSALKSFCERAKQGKVPDLASGDDLWFYLARITAGKAADYIARELTAKRGRGKVQGESAFARRDAAGGEFGIAQAVLDRDPTPAAAAEFGGACERLLAMLRSDDLREVARLKAEGYTIREIAEKFGTTARTVDRWLAEIRKTWEKEQPGPPRRKPTGPRGG